MASDTDSDLLIDSVMIFCVDPKTPGKLALETTLACWLLGSIAVAGPLCAMRPWKASPGADEFFSRASWLLTERSSDG